jgi:hypothetical protein
LVVKPRLPRKPNKIIAENGPPLAMSRDNYELGTAAEAEERIETGATEIRAFPSIL